MKIIDGKTVAKKKKTLIAEEVNRLSQSGYRSPHLVAVLVGDDPASLTYVNFKVKDCEEVGFQSTFTHLKTQTSENELLEVIDDLNRDPGVDGFIVQLPLPDHIDEQKIIESISPDKDVDGFTPVSMGRMIQGLPSFLPATPYGIIQLLSEYEVETEGKSCVIIGRSNIVGTPLSILLSRKTNPGNCTVTLCHSRTGNLAEITQQADILVAALGSPRFLTGDMVKNGAVVIDVGTTRVPSEKTKSGWKLSGDVDFESVAPKCSLISPVPGGVGPMTRIALLQNTLSAFKNKHGVS
ncbi:MAG: bifunctional 5,10-methylenetetrahydrofolate dehydrogenase/5,10-methenyltetrahydrofolate cyclohydrolase [Bacteroidales bacterium]|nr:bifunctional 5,10-methylenetetrahydrofolate dehydrogenase/5,10-methenyltetrahydrofolate cyclohydrolase [Bacteroidales bacterium]